MVVVVVLLPFVGGIPPTVTLVSASGAASRLTGSGPSTSLDNDPPR